MDLYNANQKTGEYLAGKNSEAVINRKYTPETHALADKYQYNRLTSSLIEPPATGENEVARLIDSVWEKVADFRGKGFWDTDTKQKQSIVDLGIEPDPAWTDQEPTAIQIWDGTAWTDDLGRWLDLIVRPERDGKLTAADKYMISDYPITEIFRTEWATYRQALRDLPSTLSAIVDPIPWPSEPE